MRAWKWENNGLIEVWHNATIYETKAKGLQTLDMIGKKQDFDLVFRTWELKRLRNVRLDVVDSIEERCLQWIGRERKLILNPNPKH